MHRAAAEAWPAPCSSFQNLCFPHCPLTPVPVSHTHTHVCTNRALASPYPCGPLRAPDEHSGLPGSVCDRLSPLLPTWLQYSYEGMEINNLPVELTVVWNGHFNIDNPAQNKGVAGLGPGGRRQGSPGLLALRPQLLAAVCVPRALSPSSVASPPPTLPCSFPVPSWALAGGFRWEGVSGTC